MKSKRNEGVIRYLFAGKRLVILSAGFNLERKRSVCTGWETAWRKIAGVDAVGK